MKASVENICFNKSKVTDSLVERYFELTLKEGNLQAFGDRFKASKDTSAYKNVKQIQQPTLLIWGTKDLLIPLENAYKFPEDVPNNTLIILDNTSHIPMEESPVERLKIALYFLKHSKNIGMTTPPQNKVYSEVKGTKNKASTAVPNLPSNIKYGSN